MKNHFIIKVTNLIHRRLQQVFFIFLTFQGILQTETMWLRDTGILNRLTEDIIPSPIPIPDPSLRGKLPLTAYQLSSALFCILAGLVLSVVIFIFEKCLGGKINGLKLAEDIISLD